MPTRDLFRRMVLANYGQPGGVEILEVGRIDDGILDVMRAEVMGLALNEPSSDVGSESHGTYWTDPWGSVRQWSLVNRTGRFDQTDADMEYQGEGKGFHHARRYTALARFLETRPRLVNARLNLIGPRSGLSPHKEQVIMRGRDGKLHLKARFHLPVVTNDEARMMVNWKLYRLHAGTIYYVNNGCPHAAWNVGLGDRLHVVWDTVLKPGDEALFREAKAVSSVGVHTPEEKYPSENPIATLEEALAGIA